MTGVWHTQVDKVKKQYCIVEKGEAVTEKFEFKNRDIRRQFCDEERKQIEKINEMLGEVELSEAEKRTLKWLAGWEKSTVDNFISIIEKAVQSGRDKQRMCQSKVVKKKSKCR